MKLTRRIGASEKMSPSEMVSRINSMAQREGISFAEAVARAMAGNDGSLGDIRKMDLKKLLDTWTRAA